MDRLIAGSHDPSPSVPAAASHAPSQDIKRPSSKPSSNAQSSSGTTTLRLPRRSRAREVVTPHACVECRKKRQKCDGRKPCAGCRARKDVECRYENPTRQSKESLRNELDKLRRHQRSSTRVFAALTRPEVSGKILSHLRSGRSIEAISEWLGGVVSAGNADLHAEVSTTEGSDTSPVVGHGAAGPEDLGLTESVTAQPSNSRDDLSRQFSSLSHVVPMRTNNSQTDATGRTTDMLSLEAGDMPSTGSLSLQQVSDGMPGSSGLEEIPSPLDEPEFEVASPTWTIITGDINLVRHLLALYFCWEYPTFASFSKEHFLEDFQSGHQRFCSPILVNALLALGWRFLAQPLAGENDSELSGDIFYEECQRLVHREKDHHSLTTIQALGIMSLREASIGHDSESWYCARQSMQLAIEMGLHYNDDRDKAEYEVAVRSATFWGAFALDHAWSLATGSLPQSRHSPLLPSKPAIIDKIEASPWAPYIDDRTPRQRSFEQQSNMRSVYKCFCELSELVHEALYALYAPGRSLTARGLMCIYTKLLTWYDQAPDILRLGRNFTPAVLFAHMYYHFAIMRIFLPLFKLQIINSKVFPRDICLQAAVAIQGLLKAYSGLYTLQRTPAFVPYFVLTSATMCLAIGAASSQPNSSSLTPEAVNAQVSDTFSQLSHDLLDMASSHQFAEQALRILRYLDAKWNVNLGIDDGKSPSKDFNSPVKPHANSMNFFTPSLYTDDLTFDWMLTRDTTVDSGNPEKARKTDDTEDPLFWPFPMQGRPMLPSGKDLELAGFAIL